MASPIVYRKVTVGNNLASTINFSYKKAPINEAFDI